MVQGNQIYGPYGNSRYSKGAMGTNKGFTGQYADATGLDYYNARYYDPVIGRFLSADTVQGDGVGMDPYDYVGGNPETLSDPTGHRYAQTAGGGGGPTLPCGPICDDLKHLPGGSGKGSRCDLVCTMDKAGFKLCQIGSSCVVNTAVKGPSAVVPVQTGSTSSSLLICGSPCVSINISTPPQTIHILVDTAFQVQSCLTVSLLSPCYGGGGDDLDNTDDSLHTKPHILANDPAGDADGGGTPEDVTELGGKTDDHRTKNNLPPRMGGADDKSPNVAAGKLSFTDPSGRVRSITDVFNSDSQLGIHAEESVIGWARRWMKAAIGKFGDGLSFEFDMVTQYSPCKGRCLGNMRSGVWDQWLAQDAGSGGVTSSIWHYDDNGGYTQIWP